MRVMELVASHRFPANPGFSADSGREERVTAAPQPELTPQETWELAELHAPPEPKAGKVELALVYAGGLLFSAGCWAAVWHFFRALSR